jgi:hypothetical protein
MTDSMEADPTIIGYNDDRSSSNGRAINNDRSVLANMAKAE